MSTPSSASESPDHAAAAEADAAQRKILNRLKRARGQLTALIDSFENGADCRTVVTQLSAVSSALDKAGFAIIATAMRNCALADAAPAGTHAGHVQGGAGEVTSATKTTKTGAPLTHDELEKLFLSLS